MQHCSDIFSESVTLGSLMHLANSLHRVMVAVAGLAALALSACERREPVDPYYFMQPQKPAVTPIKLDRAGEKYTMHFWVLPDPGSQTVMPYFIGIRTTVSFARDSALISKSKDFLSTADIPLEVKLTKIDEPAEKKMQLFSPPELVRGLDGIDTVKYTPLSGDLAPNRRLTGADGDLLMKNKLLDLKRDADIDDRYFQFAEARTPDPGYYRLEVRVLKDNPAMPAIATDLIVSNYRKGK
jgi:hypothetical protein